MIIISNVKYIQPFEFYGNYTGGRKGKEQQKLKESNNHQYKNWIMQYRCKLSYSLTKQKHNLLVLINKKEHYSFCSISSALLPFWNVPIMFNTSTILVWIYLSTFKSPKNLDSHKYSNFYKTNISNNTLRLSFIQYINPPWISCLIKLYHLISMERLC